jgi:predicted PhzF superfamily epimerase YddE/YHI9
VKLPIWIVDAFCTREPFSGNPAAVCPLDQWLPDATMQAIAAQNNLSETAFLVREGDGYRIRWFTPTTEVPLAGHPTLASAYVIREFLEPGIGEVRFISAGGKLRVLADGERLVLDFPANRPKLVPIPNGLRDALGVEPVAFFAAAGTDLYPVAVLGNAAEVREVRVEIPRLRMLVPVLGPVLGITAKGDDVDFVSRFFAPGSGIDEDPVTGSLHTILTPFWAERLGKTHLHARQVSARGGELWCEDRGDRVRIGGRARLYLRGEIEVDQRGGGSP